MGDGFLVGTGDTWQKSLEGIMWKWSGGLVTFSLAATAGLIWMLDESAPVIVKLVPPSLDWLKDNEKLAGWFQGVVAVIAVVGVFIAARYQVNSDTEREKTNQNTRTAEKFVAVGSSLHLLEAMYYITWENLQDEFGKERVVEELQVCNQTVQTFLSRPFDLPSPQLVWKFSKLRNNLHSSLALVEGCKGREPLAIFETLFAERAKEVHDLIAWCFDEGMKRATTDEAREVLEQWQKGAA